MYVPGNFLVCNGEELRAVGSPRQTAVFDFDSRDAMTLCAAEDVA